MVLGKFKLIVFINFIEVINLHIRKQCDVLFNCPSNINISFYNHKSILRSFFNWVFRDYLVSNVMSNSLYILEVMIVLCNF